MPINDLLLTGTFAALFKQLDGILAFGHGHVSSNCSRGYDRLLFVPAKCMAILSGRSPKLLRRPASEAGAGRSIEPESMMTAALSASIAVFAP